VAGPPKRFAQGMGAAITLVAVVVQGLGQHAAVFALLGLMIVAAGLESIAGYCVGCKVFGLLMRAGLIRAEVCAECADISARLEAQRRPAQNVVL
jgi:hypothetical protein